MMIEIKSKWTSEILFSIETDSWKLALEAAVKYGAHLIGADLSGAHLSGANLSGADLCGARSIAAHLCTPLLMLLDQPGKIRAYKLVTADGVGPFNGGIKYEIGQSYEVKDANSNPLEQCAEGINVATLDWCLREWKEGYRVLIVEFEAQDIACIPTATDGKFRLRNCFVVAEKDLTAIGWPPKLAEKEEKAS